MLAASNPLLQHTLQYELPRNSVANTEAKNKTPLWKKNNEGKFYGYNNF